MLVGADAVGKAVALGSTVSEGATEALGDAVAEGEALDVGLALEVGEMQFGSGALSACAATAVTIIAPSKAMTGMPISRALRFFLSVPGARLRSDVIADFPAACTRVNS